MLKIKIKEVLKKIRCSFENIRFLFSVSHSTDKWLLPTMFITMIMDGVYPLILVLFPKYIIDELLLGRSLTKVILLSLYFALSLYIFGALINVFDAIVSSKKEKLIQGYYKIFSDKIMTMDIEDVESSEVNVRKTRAQNVITWNSKNIDGIKNALGGIISYTIQIVLIGYIIVRFDFLLVFVIIANLILSSFINHIITKKNREIYQKQSTLQQEFNYLGTMTEDYHYGKELRIFGMKNWILGKYQSNRRSNFQYFNQQVRNDFSFKISTFVFSIIQEVIVYIVIIFRLYNQSIGVGDFVMYITGISVFSNAIINIVGYLISMDDTSNYVNDFKSFIDIEDKLIKNKDAVNKQQLEFVFHNVSFRYPNTSRYVLQNISIKICQGEKISIVGDNGAGKSTFIKLLLRLYDPTEGIITLNGKNIIEYDYSEYLSLFAPVFQDYQTFSFTIAENIALKNFGEISPTEINDIQRLYHLVGLEDKIESLPSGISTYLGKAFEETGVDFSGGELQKIAIIRSAFKNRPISILDEPTASLSPLAEYNIYKAYATLLSSEIVLSISHRLSSTKDSPRILVFEKGHIIEDNSHRNLMKANGLYQKMFKMQASYYVEEEQ